PRASEPRDLRPAVRRSSNHSLWAGGYPQLLLEGHRRPISCRECTGQSADRRSRAEAEDMLGGECRESSRRAPLHAPTPPPPVPAIGATAHRPQLPAEHLELPIHREWNQTPLPVA